MKSRSSKPPLEEARCLQTAASGFGGDITLPCQVEQSTSELEINRSQVINPENNK